MAQITLNSTGVASSGALVLQTNGTTTAVTISTGQVATLEKDAVVQGVTVGRGAGAVATNTAVGASALAANTSGAGNSAFGRQALLANTTGNQNSSFGTFSLLANTTGSANTGIGQEALFSNTTASNNTAVGYQAGYTSTTGANNTSFGAFSRQNGTGSANTFIGYVSGSQVTTGSSNTILGSYNGNQGGLDIRTANNYIVLSDGDGNPSMYSAGTGSWNITGTSSSVTGSIAFRTSAQAQSFLIATNTSNFYIFDADNSNYAYLNQNPTAWNFASDARLKENISDIDYGLSAVMAMSPKRYNFIGSNASQIGFIAQDLLSIIPEAVSGTETEFSDDDTPQERAAKTLGVGKETLIPVLVKAIQELKAEFDAYKEAHP
jgi:hypothetical protein